MKQCKICKEELIEYIYFNEKNEQQIILIHPKGIEKLPCETDGIEIQVIDQAMQNRIKQQSEESEEQKDVVVLEETKKTAKESNEDILKRRLCNQEFSIHEYDEVLKRIKCS